MPDSPTNVPPAGWYTDPADPAQERWWGGVEWTHDVRPLAAPVAPASSAPALLDVPGGGVNPFAVIDAQESSWGVPDPASAFGGPSASGLSSFEAYAAAAPARDPYARAASWQESGRQFTPGPPPTNGYATAGLVLSLLWVHLLGIIFSIIGLVRASRLSRDGELPIGRKRAVWGLSLGLAAPVLIGVLTAIAIPIYLGQQQQAAEAQQQAAEDIGVSRDQLLVEADGTPVVYDRAEYEQILTESFAEGDDGLDLDWITCPDSVDMVVGVEITCQFAYQAVRHEFSLTIVDNEGNATATLDGAAVPVQQ